MHQPSGIFLVNKPRGVSSNQLIQDIKRSLKVKKIGHAGTLDPLAEGLIIVLVNQATKLSSFLLNDNKQYQGTIQLFIKTDTGDQEGEIVEETKPYLISEKVLDKMVNKFNNSQYEQQVPLFSAVKLNGQKLYQYARNKKSVKLPTRKVEIKDLKIEKYDQRKHQLTFNTKVSKGTYIRSLAEDMAHHLGTIGHLEQLLRTESGNFKVNQAKNWKSLDWDDLINLYDTLTLAGFPIIEYKESSQDILHGKKISLPLGTPPYIFLANGRKEILAYYGLGQDGLYYCLRGGFNIY